MRCERATRDGLANLVQACRCLEKRADDGRELTVEAFIDAMSSAPRALANRSDIELEPEPNLPDLSGPEPELGGTPRANLRLIEPEPDFD